MELETPSLEALERFATSANVQDRAFAASCLWLHHDSEQQPRVVAIYQRIRETATAHHSETRARIRAGTLDAQAFLSQLESAPLDARDQLVEEILEIAYPPLGHPSRLRDVTRYSPSGLSEILFTLERARLDPERTFVDLGSGLGKVVLLVALLTGARAYGVELDPHLVAQAQAAAQALSLERARFIQGDIRHVTLPAADAYYMFIPFIRGADVAARLEPVAAERKLQLFSQPLDLEQLPWLKPASAQSYWLEAYEAPR